MSPAIRSPGGGVGGGLSGSASFSRQPRLSASPIVISFSTRRPANAGSVSVVRLTIVPPEWAMITTSRQPYARSALIVESSR